MRWPNLTAVLGDTAFAIVGAVATRLYAPERSTRDLDVAVVAGEAIATREKMRQAGWKQTGELIIGGSSWRSASDEEVNILEVHKSWWPQAIGNATVIQFCRKPVRSPSLRPAVCLRA